MKKPFSLQSETTFTLQACVGWVVRCGAATDVLHAVLGWFRLYQYYNQGDIQARPVTLSFVFSGSVPLFFLSNGILSQ
jgi:hypothetical protein